MMTLGPNPTNINPQASPWGCTTTFQASSSVPSMQEQQQTASIINNDISSMSVEEILSFYQHDTDLLKHILAVKAQDDQRKTADELRQLVESRQKFGYNNGFNMVNYRDTTCTLETNTDSMTINSASSPVYNNHHNASPNFSESSLQTSQHYDSQDISAHFDLLLSPPAPATMMMDHGMNFFPMTSHQPQEQASSVPISMDLPLMPSGSTAQNMNYDSASFSPSFATANQFMSPSSHTDYNIPDVFSTVSSCSSSIGSNPLVADLSTTRPVSCSPSMESKMLPADDDNSNTYGSNSVAPATDTKKPSPSKHKRRHTTSLPGFSSSTHVLRWAATKKKRISKPIVNINQEPQEPLDHQKVMEALRNKLTRTQSSSTSLSPTSSSSLDAPTLSSPTPAKTTPPTSPRSPPIDTQPSTSVLYLDLKSNPSPRHRNHRPQ